MIKGAVLMLGIWLAWSLWQRGRSGPTASAEDDGLAALSPLQQD